MATRDARIGPPVLILGSHIAALSVLRVLSGRGVECRVVDETKDIITRSRWYRPAEQVLAETSDSERLAEYLGGLALPSAVLIACSDVWTSAVARLPERLRGRFPASIPSAETVEQLIDKERFSALVERAGIPHPASIPVRSEADLDRISDSTLADGFLKPVESSRYYRHFGTKGQFVTSRQEAVEAVRLARPAGITFLFQEWIPGNMGKTILLDGFVDRWGEVSAIVARRRVRMDPPRIANTHCDVTIPLDDVAEAVGHTRNLLRALDYRGVFNVEYKHDERDGHFKIIEINPRPFWLIAHIARAGADLPWMSYLDAQGLPVPPQASYQTGRYGMYEVPEIAALARAWLHLRAPEGPVLAPWLRGDHTLLWASDPLPGVVDIAAAVRRRMAWLVRGDRPRPMAGRPASARDPSAPA